MKWLAMPIVVVAFLTAACAGAATVSNSKDKAAPVGAVQLNGGANAGDTSDITTRPNPPVHKPGAGVVKPSLPPQHSALLPAEPALGSALDRCSGGIGIGITGNRATGGMHPPQLMCPVE